VLKHCGPDRSRSRLGPWVTRLLLYPTASDPHDFSVTVQRKRGGGCSRTITRLNSAVASRESFLERNGLWMIDVLNRYERRPGRETSALDSDIVPPKPEDFLELRPIFASCRSLRKIAFTSQQAARWTFDALFEQQLAEKFSFSKTLEAWRSYPDENKYVRPVLSSSVLEIGVSFFILPSPSSSGRSAVPYEIIKQACRTVLFSCRDL